MDHNFIYLVWKNPETRRNYIIGKLSRNGYYTFEYCEEYREAEASGWEYLKAFPEDKKYVSDALFASFASRLPDPKRKDIKEVLAKYGMKEYDGYELLRNGGGKLPIDTYEFVDPIFPDEESICRRFYIVGVRHVSGCLGNDCRANEFLTINEELVLETEPNNESDVYAVKVMSKDSNVIGYIPRYYSHSVYNRLNKGMTYSCRIIEMNCECENCIRVELKMPAPAR